MLHAQFYLRACRRYRIDHCRRRILRDGRACRGHDGHRCLRARLRYPGRQGAVYFTIRNDGDAADKLTAVQTDAAQMAMLHENVEENGVVSMRHLEAITIAPKETVTLGPKKMHVMLTGLKAPLKKGERLAVTLTFEKAGEVKVDVPVAGVAADNPE